MQVSSGAPHMLTSNQRGRGHEPVTVLGSVRFAVAVNIRRLLADPVKWFVSGRNAILRHLHSAALEDTQATALVSAAAKLDSPPLNR